jgi:hypothetical protein
MRESVERVQAWGQVLVASGLTQEPEPVVALLCQTLGRVVQTHGATATQQLLQGFLYSRLSPTGWNEGRPVQLSPTKEQP